MEKKKLLKCALAAFTMVATAPVSADLAEINNNAGTLLAAGCGGGCGARQSVSYNEQYCNNRRAPAPYYRSGNISYNTNPQANNQQSRYSAYDANEGTPVYSTERTSAADWNRNAPSYTESYRAYATDANDASDQDAQHSMYQSSNLSDTDFQNQLSPQGKAIYQNLDAEGKALARQLFSQGAFKDRDLAIKEAQRRINERRSSMSTTGDRSNSWTR